MSILVPHLSERLSAETDYVLVGFIQYDDNKTLAFVILRQFLVEGPCVTV